MPSVGGVWIFSFTAHLFCQAEIFPDYRKLGIQLCLNTIFDCATCHMIILLKCGKYLVNYWQMFIHLINKNWVFSIQIQIIYLASFGLIYLDLGFRIYKWPEVRFCWKKKLPLTL